MNQENEISGLKGKIAELEVKLEAALYELKALKQNEEKYKGIIENSRDITEKRGTEQEIWELQNRYETIVRNFPQGAIFLFDSDLRYKMIAGAILKIIGVKSEDLEGKTVYDLFPEEFSSVTGPIAKGLFNNQTAFFEIVFLKRIYACWGLPVKNEKGQITEGLIYALDITDLKNKEKELEASKRELELVTENIPNIIWKADIDKNGKFINTYISDVVDEFLALPPKTINHDWDKYFSYINPDFIPDILNKFKDGFSNLGQTISFEYEIKKANGELAWFLSSGRAYFENDRVTVYGYTTDVTERKLVERQVKQSEEKFRNLYNNLPVGIFRSLPDGQVLYANPAMLKMYGYESEGELLKVSAKDYYVDNTDREAILRMLKENGVLRNHITHEFRKDETDIWVKTDYSAIFGDNGEIKYIEGVIEDFTERKKAEQALKESEEKFQKIFFHSPILVTLSNVEDGRYIDVNAKFLEVSQFAYDEVIGKTSTELGWVSDSDMKKLTDQIIKNGRISDMEIPFQTKTGKHILCTYHGELINIGGSTCLLSIAEDITEWKKIEKQLVAAKEKAEESDRLKSAFLATMSHELRTPLNAVIGFSEYLIDEYESPDKVKAYGKMINNGGNQLLHIIEDIFLLSLIESGEIKITVEDIPLVGLMQYVAEIVNEKMRTMDKQHLDINIHTREKDSPLWLTTDREKLEHIINYLLDNAVKFTNSGSIEMGYHQDSSAQLTFFVRDSGIGIKPEDQSIIFDRFRQVDDTYTRKYGGTGLGLYIASKLIYLLDGTIWLESEIGKGSTFYFTIPGISMEQKVARQQEVTLPFVQKGMDLEGYTILIVEDEDSNMELLDAILSDTRSKLLFARNGAEAIEFCRNNKGINLVLMDIKMPVMDGYEATRQIRTFNTNIVIIAITALALIGDREHALKAGCDDYIAKPIKKENLMKLIKKYKMS